MYVEWRGLGGSPTLGRAQNGRPLGGTMAWIRRLSWSGAVALVVGCSGGLGGGGSASTNHAPPENTAPPVDALTDPAHPGLEACAGSVSSSDLNDALEVASDFKQSCHELI